MSAEPRVDHDSRLRTVESIVRDQLSESLGGRRGMAEAAVPGVVFTLVFLVWRELTVALVVAAGLALVAVAVRLVQRTTLRYVGNALFGIAIGWLAVRLATHAGGSATDKAIAFFVPGIVVTGVYTILLVLSCLTRWPAIGFMVGSVMGDSLAWHEDRQIVRLCTRLTWLFLAPGGILVVLEAPLVIGGHAGWFSESLAVALLGVARLVIGWPLRAVFWLAMVWVLAKGETPVADRPEEQADAV